MAAQDALIDEPTGNFGPISVTVPAAATPGTHSISAEGRQSRLFAQASFTVATDWPQFHDRPERHGHNGTENVLSRLTVSGMDLDWSFATGDVVVSAPAVANGVVCVGSDDSVYALDAATGPNCGTSPPGASSSPRRRWPTGWSTSAPTTVTCTRSAWPTWPCDRSLRAASVGQRSNRTEQWVASSSSPSHARRLMYRSSDETLRSRLGSGAWARRTLVQPTSVIPAMQK